MYRRATAIKFVILKNSSIIFQKLNSDTTKQKKKNYGKQFRKTIFGKKYLYHIY